MTKVVELLTTRIRHLRPFGAAVSARLFRRGRFGAAVSAPRLFGAETIRRRDDSAPRLFGAGHFGAAVPAPGLFGAETIRCGDYSARRLFGADIIRRRFFFSTGYFDAGIIILYFQHQSYWRSCVSQLYRKRSELHIQSIQQLPSWFSFMVPINCI